MLKKLPLKKILIILLCLAILGCGAVFGIDAYVKHSTSSRLISVEEAAELADVDCVLVLGCKVYGNTSPGNMLRDRLNCGIELYEVGAAPKMVMSGDHGQHEYNEVQVMKDYAVDEGVPSSDVFMDHAGFSTYDSVYRAKDIFEADRILIVSQEYHLYRALHIADSLGIEAWGVAADTVEYSGQNMRDIREVLARVKDFVLCIFKPEPTYLGDAIPVSGNGDVTND